MNVVSAATSTSHFVVHGSPNWVDLHTSDATGSQTFYRSLFGWSFRTRFSLDPDVLLTDDDGELWEQVRVSRVAESDGRPVGEILERDEVFTSLGLPSRWCPHINVVDLNATLRRIESAGGVVLRSPKARGSLATVATVMDPGDALISLWQTRDHPGTRYWNQPGRLAWFELETPDLDRARHFYGSVFDWVVDEQASSSDYTVFGTSVGPVAGAFKSAVDQLPGSWCPAFYVDDVDDSTRSANDLGAVVMTDPYDLPVGRQSVLIDPQGAVCALVGTQTDRSARRLSPIFDRR